MVDYRQSLMEKGIAPVSQILKETRQQQGLTLEEVAQQTYIKLPYLIALEEEQYDKLPAPVYTYGYIRQYAKLLKLDGAELVSQYQAQQGVNKGNRSVPKSRREDEDDALVPPGLEPAPTRPETPAAAPEVPVPPPGDRDQSRRDLEQMAVQARQQARHITETAHQEAKQLRAAADRYADQVLAQLEQEIQRALVTIKNGRSYLHSRQLRRRHPESG